MTNTIRVLATAGLLSCCLLLLSSTGRAQDSASQLEVIPATRSDVSPPLRTITPLVAGTEKHEHPVYPTHPPNPNEPVQEDPAAQTAVDSFVATPTPTSFEGLYDGSCGVIRVARPDTNGAAGSSEFVQMVNGCLAVFDKFTGSMLFSARGNTLWAGFGGGCEFNNDGDPIAQYDKAAGRWVLTQFSVSSTPYLQCLAVSATSDATGSYYRYAFPMPNFPDYPKLGVWPDAYYMSFNMFGSKFLGAKACAFDRSAMLAGAAATAVCFQLSPSFGSLLPSDLDGSTPPPAGSPNYFLNFGSNSLNLWKFQVDFATPGNSTFTGPTIVPVAAFNEACNGGTCVPQFGTKQKLDSLGDRLMYRLAYRFFPDGHESLVVNHSVQLGTGRKNTFTGVRWYEIREPGGNPFAFQQGTFAPDSSYRWMGSVAMDKQGNMALGYSVSSSSMHPAIRFTGRLAGDPLGTMAAESSIIEGTGSQLRSVSSWGAYSSISVDPLDDCTFWYTTEYLLTDGTLDWSTRIAFFKFPGCL